MTKQVLSRVKRQSLATEVADQLRESIAAGDLPPGTRLREVELAEQLGVSRGPLREALGVLEAEGIVETRHGRGRYVARLSERDIAEMYSLRSILEQEAARLAALKGTEDEFDRLEGILAEMIGAAQGNNLAEVIDLDMEFHWEIWEIAGHQRLQGVLQELSSQIKMYLAVQTKLYEDLATGIADHQLMLDAIRNRDAEKAAGLMAEHLKFAAEVVTDYAHELDSQQDDEEAA
jgi:DNA-binding GntR family transcriptional regulator